MRIVFNQRPTAALHQPYGDPSTFFAPGIFLDPRPNEIFAHRFILVKVTMLTTWHLDGSVFQSSSVDSSIPIVDLPLSPKNIATRQHEIPLKLSILEASVDWKRGAGRMLAYINLSRCIEAMPRCRPIRVIGKKRSSSGSLTFPFRGWNDDDDARLWHHRSGGKGRPSRIPCHFWRWFSPTSARSRLRVHTIFKHRLCSIIIHGWNYAWLWFHDWFLERVERKDTIYFRPSFQWDSNNRAKVREEGKWYVSCIFLRAHFYIII